MTLDEMLASIDPLTSSTRFLKGAMWLESEIKYDEKKVKARIEKEAERYNMKTEDYIKTESWLSLGVSKQRAKYTYQEASAIYVLRHTKSSLVDEFAAATRKDAFWEHLFNSDYPYEYVSEIWYMKNAGFGEDPRFSEAVDELISEQTVDGLIFSSELCHAIGLRILVATRPGSQYLRSAVNYWLENWQGIPRATVNTETVATGILALTELDHEKYLTPMREQADYLKKHQSEDGSWSQMFSDDEPPGITSTSYAVQAISRVDGTNDPSARKGMLWLHSRQTANGSWNDRTDDTTEALLALLAMGEGPKIPCELVRVELMQRDQNLSRQTPTFIHTSPQYHGSEYVKGIHDKAVELLSEARREIRIMSPFIDMLHDDIIDLKRKNPDLSVKIITRPKAEAKGPRERIARNVVDLLSRETKGNLVESNLIHARMIIVDEEKVLVSSADLTRDQLFDEFNAGIVTADKKAVKDAIDFFENLFQIGKSQLPG